MRQKLFVFLFVLFCAATVSVNAQETDDGLATASTTQNSGYYYPRANSRTSMRKCGATEYAIQANGFNVSVTTTEVIELDWVQYCADSNTKTASTTDHLIGKAGQKIRLAPGSQIWVNPKEPGVAYAAGCLNKFGGRIPIPTPPVPTPTPIPYQAPMCTNVNMTYEQARTIGLDIVNGACVPKVMPTPTPYPQATPCPACPKITATGNKEGSWNTKQSVASGAVGGIGTGIASDGNLGQRAIKGGIGAGASVFGTWIARKVHPDFRSDASFTFAVKYPDKAEKRFNLDVGESYPVDADGLKIDWVDDHWVVDSEYCAGYFSPHTGAVFTPVILAIRTGSKPSNNTAIKNQPIVNIKPGTINNGGIRIPGGGAPEVGPIKPTRDIRTSFVEQTNAAGQQVQYKLVQDPAFANDPNFHWVTVGDTKYWARKN